MILSVDLASRRWRDNGIALLRAEGPTTAVRLVDPVSLGLHGTPTAEAFAVALDALARSEGAQLILLDGPQGWRAEASALVHQRVCERETRAPGKTGLPGVVKPATWTRMALFSIALFDALHERGWPRFRADWSGERAAIESFPTHAWRVLGERPLPGKSATETLGPWREALTRRGVVVPAQCSHDELQALVAGLAGTALLREGLAGCDLRGLTPFVEHGAWREGFIVSARQA